MQQPQPSRHRRLLPRKFLAIGSAGTVLAIGGITTLAAWNDTEWVIGNLDGAPAIGTSSFEVQQNRSQPGTADWDADAWDDHETLEGAGELQFTPGALALTPGDAVYAPVALRTTVESDPATVTLQAPMSSEEGTDIALWGVMTYSVRASGDAVECSAEAWSDTAAWDGGTVVDELAFTAELDAPSQELLGGAGSITYYCFELRLPTYDELLASDDFAQDTDLDQLQGLTIAPAWAFQSESTE